MCLKTSSSENRKQPRRLRSSVWVARGATVAEIVEHARVRIEFLVLVLREVVGLRRCGRGVYSPAVSGSAPASSLISVDLPAPLTPTSAMRSPRSMMKFDVAKDVVVAVGSWRRP